jgi:hypothetical protein
MEQTLRGARPVTPRLPVVFLQGACGDVTAGGQPDEIRKSHGGRMVADRRRASGGRKAYKTLLLIRRGAGSDVPWTCGAEHGTSRAGCPRREKVKPRRLKWFKPRKEKEEGKRNGVDVREGDCAAGRNGQGLRPEVEVEVQAGASWPGRCSCRTRPSISCNTVWTSKRGASFRSHFPVELANGCTGYVPTEEAFGPNGGDTKTRLTSYSNLEISAGRQFAETGIELANQLTPGPALEPPPAPPFRAPWPYGTCRRN